MSEVIIKLSLEQSHYLSGLLSDIQDEGPFPEGWKSEKLQSFIDFIDSQIYTPSVIVEPVTDAAPDLLEALVDLVAFYPPNSTDPCVTAARAAIAKAEGKQ